MDGFLTADPRLVPEASIIPQIGYEEAAELCFFGAKVLHPKTIRPVIDGGGAVYIRNTFNPSQRGTKVSKEVPQEATMVQSITSKSVLLLLFDVFGTRKHKREILAEIFDLACELEIPIDAIASSEATISICIEDKFLMDKKIVQRFGEIAPLEVSSDRKIICIVSNDYVRGRVGVAASFLGAVSGAGVNIEMYSQTSSEITQLVVVRSEDAHKAIVSIHDRMMN